MSLLKQVLYANTVATRPSVMYGRVLMLGLGVGEMVGVILKHKAVAELVVVEFDPRVIAAFEIDDDRLTVVEAEAGQYYRTEEKTFDFIVQDLWDEDLGEGAWLKKPEGVQLWDIE